MARDRKMNLQRIHSPTFDYLLKLVIIGDPTVGKSCLLLRFCERKFRTEHDATIGVEFGMRLVQENGVHFKVHCWDTAGQELYRSVTRSYYRFASVILLVFDVTNRKSFEHLQRWHEEVKNSCSSSAVLMVVGNKKDLEGKRCVFPEEAQPFAAQIGALYSETSALKDLGVTEAFVQPCLRAIELSKEDASSLVRRVEPQPLSRREGGFSGGCCYQ